MNAIVIIIKKERYGNIFSKSEKKMKIITTLGKIKA